MLIFFFFLFKLATSAFLIMPHVLHCEKVTCICVPFSSNCMWFYSFLSDSFHCSLFLKCMEQRQSEFQSPSAQSKPYWKSLCQWLLLWEEIIWSQIRESLCSIILIRSSWNISFAWINGIKSTEKKKRQSERIFLYHLEACRRFLEWGGYFHKTKTDIINKCQTNAHVCPTDFIIASR